MAPIGIKETSELTRFFGRFISVIGEVTNDGRVSITELFKFVELWPVIAPAVENFREALPELKDLDNNERAELKAEFEEALKLKSPLTEEAFEEGLDLALHTVQFIAKIQAFKNGKSGV